ncbi:oligosaccharide flippase family protein [Duganella sp. sic0402]|uniref:oligosaccharide flippase family protein n=1 Tax=Duganella sp. sic0402 TaxID=2854786 RepID=UPI001E33F669|nr:oligosaccharide flippase family protein [Duganella sp. sic0402]
MVVARLLTPDEVGVYAIGAVLVALAQVLRDFGVGSYIIQAPVLDDARLRAAMGVSIMVGWSLAGLVFAASYAAAWFYDEPRLQVLLQLLSLNFMLLPFSAIALPCLRRQMRFSAIFVINTIQCATQTASTIMLAVLGWGYLSLAFGAVAGAVATLIAVLCFRPADLPWLPTWHGMREILSFGAVSTTGTLVDEAGVAAPDLVIGKVAGLAEVAIYGKAMGVINVFNQLVTAAISPVIFPMFSAQARSGADVRQAYLTTASYMTALGWPFFGFVALMAPALVHILYGDQWSAAVPVIRVICIGSAVYSMFSMARYLFVAMGQVQAQARLDAMAVLARVLAVLLAAPFGLLWIGWAIVFGAVIRSGLTLFYLRRFARITCRSLLEATWCSALVAGICLTGSAVVTSWPLPPVEQLLAASAVCALLWLAAIRCVRHELATALLRS